MPQYEYVTREIGVPVCTLTAADCEELLRGRRAAEFPQWVPLNGRRAEFQVPELPDDNVVLQVPLPNGALICRENHGQLWTTIMIMICP